MPFGRRCRWLGEPIVEEECSELRPGAAHLQKIINVLFMQLKVLPLHIENLRPSDTVLLKTF